MAILPFSSFLYRKPTIQYKERPSYILSAIKSCKHRSKQATPSPEEPLVSFSHHRPPVRVNVTQGQSMSDWQA